MPGWPFSSPRTSRKRCVRTSFSFRVDATFPRADPFPNWRLRTWISVDGAPDTVPFRVLTDRIGVRRICACFTCGILRRRCKNSLHLGSTGLPKGVLNTHRMMASSLQMGSLLVSPPEAPVQVEWLPWHHTMGSNVILHGILKNGGTLYIDDGRPLPRLFHKIGREPQGDLADRHVQRSRRL